MVRSLLAGEVRGSTGAPEPRGRGKPAPRWGDRPRPGKRAAGGDLFETIELGRESGAGGAHGRHRGSPVSSIGEGLGWADGFRCPSARAGPSLSLLSQG